MGQVAVTVNGRSYAVACDDGQEARIRQLAQYLDAKVGGFTARLGQAGESRLLLLAGLVLADELAEAREALKAAQSAADSEAAAAAAGVDALAERIEAIAARLGAP
jgi:cell division protein ZapA